MIKAVQKALQDQTPVCSCDIKSSKLTYIDNKPKFADHLARNLALAGMLVLVVAAVRNARLPTGQTVLTAVQDMIETDWDESLGRISFVSRLFPDTVSVFFESPVEADWLSPCMGNVAHAWRKEEPYIGYEAEDRRVYAAASGQVMSLAHGEGEEWILRVRHEDGLETIYYGLASVNVREGDAVTVDTCLGQALSGRQVILSARRAGRDFDPSSLLSPRAGGGE